MAELEKKVAEEAKKVEEATAKAKTATDEAQAKFDEVNETVKAYKSAIDELTDDYNATLGYIENLKEVPKGEEPKDFSGGVNPSDAPSDDAKQPDEVPTAPNAPEFTGGVNPSDSPSGDNGSDFNGGVSNGDAPTQPTNPEFNGEVNDTTPPTVPDKPEADAPKPSKPKTSNGDALVQPELPEFNGGVSDGDAPTQPTNPEFNGGVNDTTPPTVPDKPEADAPKPSKPKTSNGDALVQPELPEFNGGVSDGDAPTQPTNPEFNGGVNDTTPPTVPDKPEADAPKPPKTEAPVEKAKGPKDEIKRLRDEVTKLESDLKDAENNGAEDYFKEGLQKALDNAKNELNEFLSAWLNNETEVPEFKGGVNAVAPAINEVPEFGANNPEIKKILDEIAKVKEQIKDGEENGAEPYYIEGLANRLNDLEEALNTLLENKPAIHEVPAFDLAKLGTAQPSTPGVDFGQKAPEVKEPAKVEAKNEKSLPNTGMNTSSTTALGLSLIGLIGLAVRRKLSK